jgi:hypothetical protein
MIWTTGPIADIVHHYGIDASGLVAFYPGFVDGVSHVSSPYPRKASYAALLTDSNKGYATIGCPFPTGSGISGIPTGALVLETLATSAFGPTEQFQFGGVLPAITNDNNNTPLMACGRSLYFIGLEQGAGPSFTYTLFLSRYSLDNPSAGWVQSTISLPGAPYSNYTVSGGSSYSGNLAIIVPWIPSLTGVIVGTPSIRESVLNVFVTANQRVDTPYPSSTWTASTGCIHITINEAGFVSAAMAESWINYSGTSSPYPATPVYSAFALRANGELHGYRTVGMASDYTGGTLQTARLVSGVWHLDSSKAYGSYGVTGLVYPYFPYEAQARPVASPDGSLYRVLGRVTSSYAAHGTWVLQKWDDTSDAWLDYTGWPALPGSPLIWNDPGFSLANNSIRNLALLFTEAGTPVFVADFYNYSAPWVKMYVLNSSLTTWNVITVESGNITTLAAATSFGV